MDTVELADKLADFLGRQPDIRLAYLFGSHARGRMHALSDVDVAVLLAEQLSPADQGQTRLRLMGALMALRSLQQARAPHRQGADSSS